MRGTSKASAAKAKPKPMNLKRLRTRIGVPAALIAVLLLALPGSASAALGDVEEFFAPTQPTKPLTLTEGPDGNVWYTDSTVTKIGKVTPSGTVEEFSPGLAGVALNITAGPESKLWFTMKAAKKIGSINTSGAGYTDCTVAGEPESIAAGSDGNLWFTFIPTAAPTTRRIAKMTPACGITEFIPGTTPGYASTSVAATIIAGGDGNLYYGTVGSTKSIGKITLPGETFTEFAVNGASTNQPASLTYGGDGRIWFVAQNTTLPTEERIGAITTSGTVTYYNTGLGGLGAGGASLTGLATGADGNVWAREASVRNERQKVVLKTSGPADLGGTYKLKFKGEETASIPYNAGALAVEEALAALPSIGDVKNVKALETFTGEALVERTIEFEGKLARTDVPMMECVSALTGTGPTCSVDPIQTAVAEKLYRFKPNGEFTIFPLLPRTRTVTPAASTLGKGGIVVPGPGKDLWYTTAGDVNFPATTAIGRFDLAVVEGPELTVIKEGTGDGTVVSNPSGIECGGTCSSKFETNAKVTLKASPDAESLFVSWKGCETGGVNGRECKVTMDKAKSVTAKFIQAYDVTVNRVGTGLGKVGSSPGGVLCLSNCSSTTAAFKEATNVVLTATPSKNYTFTEWTGDCSGSGTCSLSALSADKTVGAKFTAVPQHLLTVTKSGGGAGTVKAAQAGINCGATCSSMAAAYFQGQVVELTATPGKGSTFGGWSGSGCSGTGTCTVTMSAAKSVTAEFK